MYTRQEAALVRRKFWTSFGQYMRPVRGAGVDKVNWLNYKTGIPQIYFRMDAGASSASVAIELGHADIVVQQHYFEQLLQLKSILEKSTGEEWNWQLHGHQDDGHIISRVRKEMQGVSIFREADWPAIISFLKPRIIALDEFWQTVKEGFTSYS